jgi:hypothetical protein
MTESIIAKRLSGIPPRAMRDFGRRGDQAAWFVGTSMTSMPFSNLDDDRSHTIAPGVRSSPGNTRMTTTVPRRISSRGTPARKIAHQRAG